MNTNLPTSLRIACSPIFPGLHELPPKPLKGKRNPILPPPEGWTPDGIYLVAVSVSGGNPIHPAILHVGFVEPNGELGNYSEVWQNSYDNALKVGGLYYCRVISLLGVLPK